LSNLKLCFLYATYACGKSCSTFSKTTFQSWYVYSYLSCNYDAYILHMLMTIIRAFLLSSSNGKSGNGLLRDRPDRLLVNISYNASANCASTLADSEPKLFIHCDWCNQCNIHSYIITRHHHFSAFW